MALNIKDLAEQLEISDQGLDDLKNQIVKSFDDEKTMRAILSRQLSDREETHCLSCDNEGDCFILNGVIYLRLKENEDAIKELENANQHLRSKNETWNSIAGLVLLGITFEGCRKNHPALQEYKKAYEILTSNYLRIHANDYVEKARQLENELRNKIKELSTTNHSVAQPYPKKKAPQPPKIKSRLAIPWLPTYTGLQAGPNGPIWIDNLPEDKGSFLDEIILDDKSHAIYSLKQGDNLITLTSEKKYGWAKVSGNSMNASKPIPILENDFVLFYDSSDADNNAIVIAVRSDDTAAGYQYIVKRYARSNQFLVSETELPNHFGPIPITDNIRIIGVVIAVAKSEETENDQTSQTDDHTDDPDYDNGRYNKLVLLARGDQAVADRLVDHEKKLSPQSSRDDCIERAITKLLHDRKA